MYLRTPAAQSLLMEDSGAAPRTHPILRRACGCMGARASHAGAARSRSGGACREPMRASPSGARPASPCRTAAMWMDEQRRVSLLAPDVLSVCKFNFGSCDPRSQYRDLGHPRSVRPAIGALGCEGAEFLLHDSTLVARVDHIHCERISVERHTHHDMPIAAHQPAREPVRSHQRFRRHVDGED